MLAIVTSKRSFDLSPYIRRVVAAIPSVALLVYLINWPSLTGYIDNVAPVTDTEKAVHVSLRRSVPLQKPTEPQVLRVPYEKNSPSEEFFNTRSKSWFSQKQIAILDAAFHIGEVDGHGELLQAIIMQETHAGGLSLVGHMTQPVGKRSYGVGQVKVTAARDVLKRLPELGKFDSDEELIARLLTDDKFNMLIASKFLSILKQHTKSEAHAVVAYNLGLHGSQDVKNYRMYRYAKGVYANLEKVVKPFNSRNSRRDKTSLADASFM